MEFPRTRVTRLGSLSDESLISEPSTENSEIKVQTFFRGKRYNIPHNKEIDIVILGADTQSYIHVIIDNAKTRKKYADLKKLMRTFYMSMKGDPKIHVNFEEIQKDMIVAAQMNQEIIRGTVIGTDVSKRSVRLINVDGEESLTVPELRVFRMLDQFMEIPFRSIKCRLAEMENFVGSKCIQDAFKVTNMAAKFRAINIESNPKKMPTLSLIPIDNQSSLNFTILKWISSASGLTLDDHYKLK